MASKEIPSSQDSVNSPGNAGNEQASAEKCSGEPPIEPPANSDGKEPANSKSYTKAYESNTGNVPEKSSGESSVEPNGLSKGKNSSKSSLEGHADASGDNSSTGTQIPKASVSGSKKSDTKKQAVERTFKFHVVCPDDDDDDDDDDDVKLILNFPGGKKKEFKMQKIRSNGKEEFSEYQCSVPYANAKSYTVKKNKDKSHTVPLMNIQGKDLIKYYHTFISDSWTNWLKFKTRFESKNNYFKSAFDFFTEKILAKIISLPLKEVWSTKEIIDNIAHICKCLNQKDTSEKEFAAVFIDVVIRNLKENLTKDKKFLLAYLAVEFCVKMQAPVEERHILCQNLLLPTEERETWEYLLEKYIQNKPQNGDMMKKFCWMCVNDNDPSWLYCIPLIHFQFNDIEPSALPNFDFKNNTWWGTKHIQRIINSFQNSSVKEDVVPILRKLKELYLVDTLLPQSLVAALPMNKFHDGMNCKLLPMNACLGRMRELLLTSYNEKNYETSMNLIRSLPILPDDETAIHQCREILRELLKIAIRKDFIAAVPNILHIWFKTLPTDEINDINESINEVFARFKVTKVSLPEFFKICDRLFIACSEKSDWETETKKTLKNKIWKSSPHDVLNAFLEVHTVIETDVMPILCEYTVAVLPQLGAVGSKFIDLLSKIFSHSWPQTEDVSTLMNYILQWESFKDFVIYYRKERDKLTESCLKSVSLGIETFQKFMEDFQTGEITVLMFNTFFEKERQVKDISKTIDSAFPIEKIIRLRKSEKDLLNETEEQIRILLDIGKYVNMTGCEDLKRKLGVNKEQFSWNEICDSQYGEPAITYYYDEIPSDLKKNLKKIRKLSTNRIFLNIIKESENSEVDLSNMNHEVIEPTLNKWEQYCRELKDGSLSFEDIDTLFDSSDREQISAELKNMIDDKLLHKVKKQILRFKFHKTSKDATDLILQMRNELKLQGSFETIEAALNIADKKGRLRDLGEKVCNELAFLDGYTAEKIKCLKKFLDCDKLRMWITEYIADMKQLGVFVELATMSAGEGDLELQKVMCLHSAVIGYGPLIFNVNPESDFETLDSRFKEVWDAFAQDENLPRKLEDAQHELDWLNNVLHTQGSVEIASISLAQRINKDGIYHIEVQDHGVIQDMNSIIKVMIMETNKEKRQLSYKEMTDLKSRLMLVVGKAEQENKDVKVFSDVLDNITNLGQAFLKLYEAGNILYQYMTIVCYMSSEIPISTTISFLGMDEPIRCQKKSGENIAQQIGNISSFFEKCLSPWTDHIEKNRDKWYELNYYTIRQISFLQKQIADMQTKTQQKNQSMDCRMYPLLSMVKKNCSYDDVLKARKEAEKTIEEITVKNKSTKLGFMSENEETNQFIQELLDIGCTVDEAFQALDKFGNDGIDDATMWFIGKSGSECDNKEEKPFLSSTLGEEIAKRGTSGDLIENLEQIWERFMTVATLDHADIISVEHVGIILHHLSAHNRPIKRAFPSMLLKGQPNLLVCSQDDILHTTLGLYMESKDQPLPQADEIIFCTKDTTVEQVGIFIKRAMLSHSNKGKLYCMVHADSLNYDASEEMEKKLHKYLKGCPDYKLVIMCSEENEYKSRIAAALEKFRIPCECPFKPSEIKDYIKNKFQNEEVPEGINPAYTIDVSHSSVRLINSSRPGCGKTLYKNTLAAKLKETNEKYEEFSISLYENEINKERIMESILRLTDEPDQKIVRLFHFDISLEVRQGVDELLFNLLILGQLVDDHGFVWLRQPYDIYLVETFSLNQEKPQNDSKDVVFLHQILEILPNVTCRTPSETLKHHKNKCFDENDQFFHEQVFSSDPFKRTFKHLMALERNPKLPTNPDKFFCLEVILRYCGIDDPTWSQLNHFIKFFNIQLMDVEESIYCNQTDILIGFKEFVVKFLLQMSQDFANVTVNLSEKSSNIQSDEDFEKIERFQLRRKWETTPHPYLFFNDDKMSLTFLGFKIDRATGNLLGPNSNDILKTKIMSTALFDELVQNKVPLNENFDDLPRIDKICRLCYVMQVEYIYDPDPTYELTTDNVKKMLAIYMRYRCDIPVVVMGETGCGKTRLIRFMCQLQVPPNSNIQNMLIMKIHGGTTRQDIISKINNAIELSKRNATAVKSLKTILFFDEANTTEAIGMIKDIMCDKIIDGKSFDNVEHLKIVAACNPYRKHSQNMIEKLKQAGLGYNVDDNETTDKFGQTPMRHLVYRVKPLPPSMLALVWDFGQLDKETEQLYINQMVASHDELQSTEMITTISKILVESQCYMREQENECSFVSLRNVERTLHVMNWFTKQDNLHDQCDEILDVITRSLILALSVCYHSSLQHRSGYRTRICQFFRDPLNLPGGEEQMLHEITRCQDIILSHVQLESTVAKNRALLENVFMMTVCIELRIPLFLVGKPGSSKSLAKTIVANAMQGKRASTEFFKCMKQAHMISFQCSPLSTTDGILSVFSQGIKFQEKKDLKNYVSVVVLDEIGLAEDSSKMPLKILHPLIEDGCLGDETPEPHKKVAFIGISNWALDPAKMNRGISVQRDIPGIEELVSTAKGICSSNKDVQEDKTKDVLEKIENIFEPVARAYTDLLDEATNKRREFFGLRDFYSMVKMIFASANEGELTWPKLAYAIKRNFGGLDSIDAIEKFENHLENIFDVNEKSHQFSHSTRGMIEACLEKDAGSERRYLLLLMENYTDLNMIKQYILCNMEATMIFGSSFPQDQLYTKICHNIKNIKICMEIGRTVILLNLENLYESLYDALNQFYVYFDDVKFVDLGLGTHRIKCKVNDNFRLIVLAEKEVVYSKFPVPLINRLEKHYLTLSSFLTQDELELIDEIKESLRLFIDESEWKTSFVGFTESSLAAIILYLCRTIMMDPKEDSSKIINLVKMMLLKIAKPDAIVKIYINKKPDSQRIAHTYFKEQKHNNISDFIEYDTENTYSSTPLTQITTYNKMLSKTDSKEIAEELKIKVVLLNLEAIATELRFRDHVRNFFESGVDQGQLLIIQCLSADRRLIVNSQSIIQDEFHQVSNKNADLRKNVKVFFIIQLCILEQSGFNGFQVGGWQSFHIDNLHKPPVNMPPVITMMDESFEDLFENSIGQKCGDQIFDVRKLLQECIPAAISSIRDGGGSERAIKRMNILKNLLEDEESGNILSHKISASLKRKMNTFATKHWLLKQIEQENRIKFGCFGNMILQYMKQKIKGHLADVISAVDINSNLDIPKFFSKDELKTKLWMVLFKNNKLLETTSFLMEKKEFENSFPFSWIFFQIIKNFQVDDLKTRVEISLVNCVKENVFFKELEKFSDEFLKTEDRKLFLWDYLRDFVQMTHECISQPHIKILEEQLICAVKQHSSWDESDIISTMVRIHETFSKMEFRFQNFSSMVRLNPQIIDKLLEKCESTEEMTMDVVALDLLLSKLEPKQSQLDEEDGRKEWIQSVSNHFTCVLPILKIEIPNNTLYGESCWSSIKKIKSFWTKILAVKFFIHHMNPLKKSGINKGIKLCRSLWLILKGNADMKTIETFEKTEKFLQTCNTSAMKHLHDTYHKCSMCGKEIYKSVILPCQCISCENCLEMNEKCLKCNKPLPKDFQPDFKEINRKALNEYEAYRDALNGFFMELISQLCFTDGCSPSQVVFDKLMGYILKVNPKSEERIITKQISISDRTIDPTPILRSFLIQLLMQARREDSDRHLVAYVKRMETEMEDEKSFFKLTIILIIHCMEDDLRRRSTERVSELDDAIDALKSYIEPQEDMSRLSLYKMRSLASVRFGLDMCTRFMYKCYTEESCLVDDKKKHLFRLAEQLCTMQNTPLPKVFIFKMLLQKYGQYAYKKVTEHCPWAMTPINREEGLVAPDFFVVWEDDYEIVRDSINRLRNGIDHALDNIAEISKKQERNTFIISALAIYREITCLIPKNQRIPEKHIKEIKKRCSQYDFMKSDIIKDLFKNRFGKNSRLLEMKENLDLHQQGLFAMLLHYYVVLINSEQNHFFKQVLKNPDALKKSFFPTMPEDIISKLVKSGADTFNECPNGHLYLIGNCGKPDSISKCAECGAAIGGENHRYNPGNKKIEGDLKDRFTHNGYLHGPVKAPDIPYIERDMDRTCTTLMRIFLHSSMFLAANENPQVISGMIRKLEDKNVFDFLQEHISNELNQLTKLLDRNLDDIFLLIHFIIKQMFNNMPDFEVSRAALRNEEDRRIWENKFSENYFKPHILNMENILDKFKKKISEDVSNATLSNTPDNLSDDISFNDIENEAPLWKYRPHITMEHFKNQLLNRPLDEGTEKQLRVLKSFFNRDHQLFALRFIPDIIKLQSILLRKYQYKLSFQQVKQLTMRAVLEEIHPDTVRKEISALVDSFIQAWKYVKSDLQKSFCVYDRQMLNDHREHCDKELSRDSLLAYFIPYSEGPGVCSYALLQFLIKQHNDFMDEYYKEIEERPSNASEVLLSEVRQIHVIDFDPERDFYFLVLPNSNYKFFLDRNMLIEYNFIRFQHQLEDRFLNGKIKIKLQQIETIIFKGDILNTPLFKRLCENIVQIPIPKILKNHISQELKDLPRIKEDVENLETVISFLVNNNGDSEIKLSEFMSNVLQMKTEFSSNKVNEFCGLQHAKYLWLLLNMKIEKLLVPTNLSKAKFDTVRDKYKVDLSGEEINVLRPMLKYMGDEALDDFISVLFEFIFCYLPQARNLTENSLKADLGVHLELEENDLDIEAFPDVIKVKNTVATWTLAVKILDNHEI